MIRDLPDFAYVSHEDRRKTLIEPMLWMAPSERLAFIHEREELLKYLLPEDLTKVGTLLCHASSPEMRKAYPIIGERVPTEQEQFEVKTFGDEDKQLQGDYVSLTEVLEDEEGDDD